MTRGRSGARYGPPRNFRRDRTRARVHKAVASRRTRAPKPQPLDGFGARSRASRDHVTELIRSPYRGACFGLPR